jgi:hypothetical protein
MSMPGARLEQLASEMKGVADSGRAVGQPVLRIAREHDELLHRPRRHGGIEREHVAFGAADRSDGLQVREHVIAKLAVDARVHRDRRRGNEQRVSVRRRLGDRLGSDGAVRGRPILHDDGLPRLRLEFFCHHPRDRIRRAGREWDDDGGRSAGV